METERKTCFVIMPFSGTTDDHTEDYWTRHFSEFLRPLIEEADSSLELRRSSPLRGDVVKQIITDLILSPVVVADLTDRNANVFWELGVRQSFKHGTITIIDATSGTIPFDLTGKGTLHYHPNDHIRLQEFRAQFKNAVRDCLANPNAPDSEVLETITGRGTLFEMFRRDETIRRLNALVSEIRHNKHIYELDRFGDSGLRFRTVAIQLLVTNGYLDENDAFYTQAENFLYEMEYLDEQHRRYYEMREQYVPPLEEPLDTLKSFESKIDGIRNKLISQV